VTPLRVSNAPEASAWQSEWQEAASGSHLDGSARALGWPSAAGDPTAEHESPASDPSAPGHRLSPRGARADGQPASHPVAPVRGELSSPRGRRSADGAATEHDAEAVSSGRHTVPDELVQAATYRLAPDRIARAKVRQPSPEDLPEDRTTRLPETSSHRPVPKPRSS
jgi:hypothetical protein